MIAMIVAGALATGVPEAVGYVGGGLIGGGIGFWGGHKVGTTAYDWLFTPVFSY